MPVLIDPRGGSDRVATGAVVTAPSAWSAYGWLRRASGTVGNIFSLGDATPDIDVYYSFSTVDRLTLDRRTDGVNATWHVTAANDGITYADTDWVWVALTQNGIGTPVVYTASPTQGVAFGARTVTVVTAGSGTATTTASQVLWLGNWNNLDYALGGDLAWFGLHNVVLTEGELQEAMLRGLTMRGLVTASELQDSTHLYDLSGSAATLTGTGVSDVTGGPPVVPLWVPTLPRQIPQTAAAAPPVVTMRLLASTGVGT